MNNRLRGLYAGLAAGAFVALLFFVDYGPGNGLRGVAHWFALDNPNTGKWIGVLLLIILGGLFGLLFGVLQGQRRLTIRRALLTGLALGLALWFIFAFVVGTFIGHIPLTSFNLSSFLYPFVLSLFLGFLIGAVYYQSTLYSTLAT